MNTRRLPEVTAAHVEVSSAWGMDPAKPFQPRHEAPELGSMVGRMLNALIRRAAEGDLEAVEALAALEDLARQANTSGMTLARDRYSLDELAKVVGTSRQAVSQRAPLGAAPRLTTAPCDHHGCVGRKTCRYPNAWAKPDTLPGVSATL